VAAVVRHLAKPLFQFLELDLLHAADRFDPRPVITQYQEALNDGHSLLNLALFDELLTVCHQMIFHRRCGAPQRFLKQVVVKASANFVCILNYD
jgi:hypothetical protein